MQVENKTNKNILSTNYKVTKALKPDALNTRPDWVAGPSGLRKDPAELIFYKLKLLYCQNEFQWNNMMLEMEVSVVRR